MRLLEVEVEGFVDVDVDVWAFVGVRNFLDICLCILGGDAGGVVLSWTADIGDTAAEFWYGYGPSGVWGPTWVVVVLSSDVFWLIQLFVYHIFKY